MSQDLPFEQVYQVIYNTPYRRSSSIEGHLLSKVIYHQRLSSVKGRLSSKVVIRQRSSYVEGHLPSKVVFCQRSSFVKGCLPLKVVLRQMSSSIKGRLPSKFVFCQWSSSFSYAQTHRHTDAHALHYNIDYGILTNKNVITHMCLCFLVFFLFVH